MAVHQNGGNTVHTRYVSSPSGGREVEVSRRPNQPQQDDYSGSKSTRSQYHIPTGTTFGSSSMNRPPIESLPPGPTTAPSTSSRPVGRTGPNHIPFIGVVVIGALIFTICDPWTALKLFGVVAGLVAIVGLVGLGLVGLGNLFERVYEWLVERFPWIVWIRLIASLGGCVGFVLWTYHVFHR